MPLCDPDRSSRLSRRPRLAHSRTVTLEQEAEHQPVRDEKERYHEGRDEVSGTQLTRGGPDTGQVTLVERVEEIRAAPEVEHPDQGNSQPARQRRQGEQGQDRGNEIAVGSWAGERGRQVRRNHARHQERQADEPEAVQEEERPEGAAARLEAKRWP